MTSFKEIFLACALALPAHTNKDYPLLKEFIEKRHPEYTVVFINEDEQLLNPGAERTPVNTHPEGLRIWMIKRSA